METMERIGFDDFLYHEAELLDEGHLDEWVSLFSPDGLYWITDLRNSGDPRREASWAYDDVSLLREKIWRIQSGSAYSQDPPSITRHLVSNIRLRGREDEVTNIRSTFVVYELRRSIQTTFVGEFDHTLVRSGGDWKIQRKKVTLLNMGEPISNLTFML